MSANTIRHKPNSENYDNEGFINQLLASQQFDELADKVAEKAASRIKIIEASRTHLEKLHRDGNKVNSTENIQQDYRNPANRKYDNEYKGYEKAKVFNAIQIRNDNEQGNQGKIDTQALMMDETTSHSDTLRLKYKYLTRNAYEKKLFSERTLEKGDHPIPRHDENEESSNHNEKMASAEKNNYHDPNTEGSISKQDDTEKSQYNPKKEYSDEDNRGRHDTKGGDRKDIASDRNSRTHDDSNSRTQYDDPNIRSHDDHNSKTQDDPNTRSHDDHNSKTQDDPNTRSYDDSNAGTQDDFNSTTQVDPNSTTQNDPSSITQDDPNARTHGDPNSTTHNDLNRKTQDGPNTRTHDELDNGPDGEKNENNKKNQSAEHDQSREQTRNRVDQNTSHESTSSTDEENQVNAPPSEENTHEESDKTDKGLEKSSTEEDVENEELILTQFRVGDEEKHRETLYPNVEENKLTSDNNQSDGPFFGRWDPEASDHRSEEQREQSPDDHRTEETGDSTSQEDQSSTSKPVMIRQEGDKLFTFVEVPEYAEYHEKFAKQMKEHPDNPADFI